MKLIKRIFVLFSFLFCAVFSLSTYAVETNANQMSSKKISILTVSINNADAETLAAVLNGIGMKRARSIVAYRKTNGAFKTIDELKLVKGIGESILEKNRSKIKL